MGLFDIIFGKSKSFPVQESGDALVGYARERAGQFPTELSDAQIKKLARGIANGDNQAYESPPKHSWW